MDARVERAKKLMGQRLRKLREGVGLSVYRLAQLAKRDRSYIHDIEAGQGNPTIEHYAELVSKCGVDFEEFLVGLQTADIPPAHQPYHRMLALILKSDVKELIDGIRINLEAISEKAVRLKKSRASPGP